MHEPQDRRSALTNLAAGASAAVGAAMAVTSGANAGAAAEKSRKRKVRQLWEGRLVNPVYTPLGAGDTIYYTITAQGAGAGTMADMRRKRTIEMTDARFFRYLQHKTGGAYTGAQSLRLQGMNWRVLGVDFDASSDTWTLVVRICDSNPDKRPTAGASAEKVGDEVTGCSCDCDYKCFECSNGNGCGDDFCQACGGDAC